MSESEREGGCLSWLWIGNRRLSEYDDDRRFNCYIDGVNLLEKFAMRWVNVKCVWSRDLNYVVCFSKIILGKTAFASRRTGGVFMFEAQIRTRMNTDVNMPERTGLHLEIILRGNYIMNNWPGASFANRTRVVTATIDRHFITLKRCQNARYRWMMVIPLSLKNITVSRDKWMISEVTNHIWWSAMISKFCRRTYWHLYAEVRHIWKVVWWEAQDWWVRKQ